MPQAEAGQGDLATQVPLVNQAVAEQGDLSTLVPLSLLTGSQNLIVDLFFDLGFQNGCLVLTAPDPDNSLSVMKLIIFSIYNLPVYYKSLYGYVRKRSEMYTIFNPIFYSKTEV